MENSKNLQKQITEKQKILKTNKNQIKNTQLNNQQLNRLINIIKQRYISPYKIVYMINQQQADIFKARNQSSGCCSSSSITIPKHQMTKTQLFLSQEINNCLKYQNLNHILQELSTKFQNIVKSGQKQNLKVDQNVQKFLMEKVLSEGINLYLYNQVMKRLKKQNQSIVNGAMLWATPNTWYAKYPKTPLNFISSNSISDLNNIYKGYLIESGFLKDYKDNLFKQLRLLQRDGRFQQLLWSKYFQQLRNDKKVLNFPQNFAIDGQQENYKKGQLIFPYLKKSLLTLRSIPFELNAKCNIYCTISQNNQISYFKDKVFYKVQTDQKSNFSTYSGIGNKFKCELIYKNKKIENKIVEINQGDLLIVDNKIIENLVIESNIEYFFLFKSWIFTLQKNN